MRYDYLIIGQGISGTMLSWALMRRGKKVLVIDQSKPATATKVASGVINPVTGRRIMRSWQIEKIMPVSVGAYREMEALLGISFIKQCNIISFHTTPQMRNAFTEKMETETDYLSTPIQQDAYSSYFNYRYGVGEIGPSWHIDLHAVLQGWREYLRKMDALLETSFEHEQLRIEEEGVRYNDIHAQSILYSEGAAGFTNPFFRQLPFAPNKGQALIVEITGLPNDHIYKHGITLVPWKENTWWAGSSFEWNYPNAGPTPAFAEQTQAQLRDWLKLPYCVLDHIAAERPATVERRPFVGMHPQYKQVGIFNGMGTKGCSLSPYLALQFAAQLAGEAQVDPPTDVKRFERILTLPIN